MDSQRLFCETQNICLPDQGSFLCVIVFFALDVQFVQCLAVPSIAEIAISSVKIQLRRSKTYSSSVFVSVIAFFAIRFAKLDVQGDVFFCHCEKSSLIFAMLRICDEAVHFLHWIFLTLLEKYVLAGAKNCTVWGDFLPHLGGLYMTMSAEPSHSAACARCSRQVLSKEASDDTLWKMKPKMRMVQEMCEVQSELLGKPRKFWTYKDESFTGVVSSMAHSRGGSATASAIPLRVLDTHRALSR